MGIIRVASKTVTRYHDEQELRSTISYCCTTGVPVQQPFSLPHKVLGHLEHRNFVRAPDVVDVAFHGLVENLVER